MSEWYYYDNNGEKVGPVTATLLKELARQGVVMRETKIENVNGRSEIAGKVRGLPFLETTLPKSDMGIKPQDTPAVTPPDTSEIYDVATPPSSPVTKMNTSASTPLPSMSVPFSQGGAAMSSAQNTQGQTPTWYYYTSGNTQRIGPITVAQLKKLAKMGHITPETLVENTNGRQAVAGKIPGIVFSTAVPVPEVTPAPATTSQTTASTSHANRFCTHCGKPIVDSQVFCGNCGAKVGTAHTSQPYSRSTNSTTSQSKNKTVAAVLALIFGNFGMHWFYLGNKRKAITRLCIFISAFICLVIGFGISIVGVDRRDQEFIPFVFLALGGFVGGIVGILAVIDAIKLFTISDTEFDALCNEENPVQAISARQIIIPRAISWILIGSLVFVMVVNIAFGISAGFHRMPFSSPLSLIFLLLALVIAVRLRTKSKSVAIPMSKVSVSALPQSSMPIVQSQQICSFVQKYDSPRNRVIAATATIALMLIIGTCVSNIFNKSRTGDTSGTAPTNNNVPTTNSTASATKPAMVKVSLPSGVYPKWGADYTLYVDGKEVESQTTDLHAAFFHIDVPVGTVKIKAKAGLKNGYGAVLQTYSTAVDKTVVVPAVGHVDTIEVTVY